MSKIPADVYRKYVEDVNTAHLTGFTFVVISIVHLSGGKITEGMQARWFSEILNLKWYFVKAQWTHCALSLSLLGGTLFCTFKWF